MTTIIENLQKAQSNSAELQVILKKLECNNTHIWKRLNELDICIAQAMGGALELKSKFEDSYEDWDC